MIYQKVALLAELNGLVAAHQEEITKWKMIPEAVLQSKEHPDQWSAVECIEHLNMYARFYNAEIKRRLDKASKEMCDEFKSGYWGNRFAQDMLPKADMKTMKTFKSKTPVLADLAVTEVLEEFTALQAELMELLSESAAYNLTKIKTAITLPLLKFRLGDTFRFVIYHNERHVVQARKAIEMAEHLL